ncbi:GNAT family N-acetyltransferase [Kluyvera sichuanensis]|uniref:GNAT family N-acetyltransferase n=1 Tax=Kluyvera sichuanensis TaxID=2725494 RepID=UPI0039F609ED
MYTIAITPSTDPTVNALIAELDRYQSTLYPEESNHLLDLTSLPQNQLIVMVIRKGEEAVGCGAIVLDDTGSGEMKRVFINPTHRGQRLGEKLLAELETAALQRGCRTLQLETGIHQHAAICLYQRCGYEVCDAFAPYQPDPLSVFMVKPLAHPVTQ